MLSLWYLPLHHCQFISQPHYFECASIVILAACWKYSSHNMTVIGWKQSMSATIPLRRHGLRLCLTVKWKQRWKSSCVIGVNIAVFISKDSLSTLSVWCALCTNPNSCRRTQLKTPPWKLLSFMLFKFQRTLPKWVGIYKKHCTPGPLTVFFLSFQPYHQVEVPQFSPKSEPSVLRWLHPNCVTSLYRVSKLHPLRRRYDWKLQKTLPSGPWVENIFVKLLWFHVENQLSRWV